MYRAAVFACIFIVSLAWSTVGQTHAQSAIPDVIRVGFNEAPLLEDCSRAIAQVGGTRLWVQQSNGELDRPPIINSSAEASGRAPECWLYDGASLEVWMNQPATAIRFHRSGTLRVQLYRENTLVLEDVTSGLGGRYEYVNGRGFQRIVITEAGQGASSYAALDELVLETERLAVSHVVRFDAVGATNCAENIQRADWVMAQGGTFDAERGACYLPPQTQLSISAAVPFQYWDVHIRGTGTILLAQPTRPAPQERGFRAESTTFIQPSVPEDYTQMFIVAGEEGATLESLRLTWLLENPQRLYWSSTTTCADAVQGQHDIHAESDTPAPQVRDDACVFEMGATLRLQTPTPIWVVWLVAEGEFELQSFAQDGTPLEQQTVIGNGSPQAFILWSTPTHLSLRANTDAANIREVVLYPSPMPTP